MYSSTNDFRGVPGEYNRTMDDPCAIVQRNNDNGKKLKFITTNHADLIQAKDSLNFFGMSIKDSLFVPSNKMDEDSSLRMGGKGGVMTNCNTVNSFGALPLPTAPSMYQLFHGDVEKEDAMRYNIESNRKSCIPTETTFFDRSFYIFKGIEEPSPIKSVETSTFGPRGGASTRFVQSKKI